MKQEARPIAPVTPSAQYGTETTDPDSFDLRLLLRTLLRKRRLILGVMLSVAVAVYLLVRLLPPTYTAEAKIILDPRKARVTASEAVVASVDPSEQIVNGEIQVLNSNILLNKVRRALPEAAIAQLDPTLRATSFLGGIKAMLPGFSSGAPSPLTALAPDGKDELQDSLLMQEIRDSLRIFNENVSFVITIRAEAGDADLARILANTVADTYIETQLESRQDAVKQATKWLELRVATLRKDVEAAESAVADFASANLLRDGGTLENATQQLAQLNSQLIDARTERLTAQARLEELTSVVKDRGLLAGASLVTSDTMNSLRARELDLNSRDAVWARSFAADQPKRVEISDALNEVRSAMETEVRNALTLLRSMFEIAASREDNLRKNITLLEGNVSRMTQSGLGLRQLEREADAARSAYDALLTRLTEAQTQQQMQLPDAKLIARAVTPKIPSAPRPKLFAIFAAAVAGTATIAFIFFNEMTPTTFRSVREVEAATNLPVLTSMPFVETKAARRILDHLKAAPYGPYAERTRQLRSALDFSERRSQSVILLSSAPGEGKSTAAIALAHMAAKSGLGVIIVDCDLRKPSLASTLELKQKLTFVDFIQNKCQLYDAIDHDTGHGFDVLAPHQAFSDGADELSLTWLVPLIEELKLDYDVVVVDSPPVLAVSDALTLAQMVDKRLYVIGFDSTHRTAIRDGLAQLREARIGVDGIVFSKVDSRRSSEENYEDYGYY